MRIILLGAPGAGKGTQAKVIQDKFNITHISTGDMIRETIKSGSELGNELKKVLDAGQLVSDEFIIKIVKDRISKADCKNGFMLDGVPRTIVQAEKLDELGVNIDYIVEVDIADELLIERITGRRVHPASGRTYHIRFSPPKIQNKDDITGDDLITRTDDNEATVKERLSVYHQQTSPLINFYKNFNGLNTKAPKYIKVNGDQAVEKVSQDIFNKIS
ncbi:adenylate kinase [Francisella adeliensis]|uniref:Adenylate kinase n=1 Tax=Francisella adeliensis TaxID=2007306 RepID=A0A2Z4XZB1_9GAMM|nr:adenylate kinase [Francisella adeliensis]AXA33988.1 adenylate kinase [Francisella adeliensis]MBK2085900.1 adenylate kinase [Francisella adeliensis]MBK2097778.1 adenylate kinase [Francisella adeliensis]QIW12225.1 adenylate kinase [Francisella adeliensis]QIW14101.1 adenylate kinase [Francisella adeliensis]